MLQGRKEGRKEAYTGSRTSKPYGAEASSRRAFSTEIYGWPYTGGGWCHELKPRTLRIPGVDQARAMVPAAQTAAFLESPLREGQKINIVQYIGIAADEPKRIARHIGKPNVILPLVELGWEEGLCGLISKYQGLLAPTYTEESLRDGCWFCHNQSIGQLRRLRKNYPDLWALLLKWDTDSPVSFHPDGHTVHDFDERFALEDEGLISPTDKWRWDYLNCLQLRI